MKSLRVTLLAVLAIFLASGCVSSRIVSNAPTKALEPVEQFVLLVKTGEFQKTGGVGSGLGQRNLDHLIPHLVARLPVIFDLNAVPMKAESQVFHESTLSGKAKVLIVKPVSALYNTRTGQTLNLRAEVLDVKTSTHIWSAEITLHTMGFGKFDEKLADEIAVKLLAQLRTDGLISLPEAEPRTMR